MFNSSIEINILTIIGFCIILIISLITNYNQNKQLNMNKKDYDSVSFIMQHLNLDLHEDKYSGIAKELLENLKTFKSKIGWQYKIWN